MCYDLLLVRMIETTHAKIISFWRHFRKNYAPNQKTFGACFSDVSVPYFFDHQLMFSKNVRHRLQYTVVGKSIPHTKASRPTPHKGSRATSRDRVVEHPIEKESSARGLT